MPLLLLPVQQEGQPKDPHQNPHRGEAVHLPAVLLPRRPESEPPQAHTDSQQGGIQEEQKCPLALQVDVSAQ